MEKSIFQIPFKTIRSSLFYRKSQFWGENQLTKYKEAKIRELLIHAGKHVPYYRDLFKKNSFDPASFVNMEDLKRIPTLEKETVRTEKKDLMAYNAVKYGITNDSTSGSTGTPLHFALSDEVQANKLAALLRSYGWAGYRPALRTFSLQSYYFEKSPVQYNRFYNILRFDSNKLCKITAGQAIDAINKFRPVFFMGFPFDLQMLARFAQQLNKGYHKPDSILTYGETLSDNRKKQLEDAYKCPVFNFYSLHECSAMIAECEKGSLHLIDDFAHHETITENGRTRLIGTSYYNYSMPLIRYEIRDEIELEKDHKCSCGRPFPVVNKIEGKQCDFIQTPNGRFLGAVMSHSIDNARGVVCSQCIQHSLTNIEVKLIADESYDENSQILLEKGLRKRLGNEIKLEFSIVQELEKRASGKTPFIISKIGNVYE